LIAYLIDKCEAQDPSTIRYGDIGPILLQNSIRYLNYEPSIVSSKAFCSMTWTAVNKIVHPDSTLTPQTLINTIKDQIRTIVRPHINSDESPARAMLYICRMKFGDKIRLIRTEPIVRIAGTNA
jgi:hypothetical protein